MTRSITVPGIVGVIDTALLYRAVEALEECAQMQAGMTQAPDLIRKEETDDWKDAQVLRAALDQGLLP